MSSVIVLHAIFPLFSLEYVFCFSLTCDVFFFVVLKMWQVFCLQFCRWKCICFQFCVPQLGSGYGDTDSILEIPFEIITDFVSRSRLAIEASFVVERNAQLFDWRNESGSQPQSKYSDAFQSWNPSSVHVMLIDTIRSLQTELPPPFAFHCASPRQK